MMDFQPRRLLVFNRVERKALSSGLLENLRQFIHGMALIVLKGHRLFVKG